MRITRIKLMHFIGIKKGMEVDEIEIKFPTTENNIVVLRGDNGSGKTTVLSNLQPFHESNDGRSKQILEEEDGEKHLDLLNGEDVYKCSIYYKAVKLKHSTKCYITKNGVELNSNGNISSYNVILEKEFGLTKDYFKIGRIGSNVANFIDLSKADRKKYISKLLPNIDKYLRHYIIVNRKHAELKTKIKYASEKLLAIPNKVELHNKEEAIIAKLNEIELQVENINKDFGYYDKSKSDLVHKMEVIKNDNLEFFSNIGRLQRQYTNNKSQVRTHLSTVKELLESNDIDSCILQNTSELESVYNKLSALQKENESLTDSINKDNASLAELKKDITIVDELTEKQIIEREALIVSGIKELTEFCEGDKFFSKIKELRDTSNISASFKQTSEMLAKFIESMFTFKNMYNNNEQNMLEKKLHDAKTDHKDMLKTISKLEANMDQYELLQKRPVTCNIDTCPFISNSLQFKGVKDSLDSLLKDVVPLNENINEYGSTLADYSDMRAVVNNLEFMLRTIRHKEEISAMLGNSIFSISELFSFNINDINIIIEDISDITQTITYYNELKKKEYDLKLAKSKINELNTNKKLFNNIKNQIVSYDNSINSLNIKLSENIETIKQLQYRIVAINDNNIILNTIMVLNKDISKHESLITIKGEYDTLNKELMLVKSNMLNMDGNLTSLKKSAVVYNKSLDNIKIHLTNIDTFNKDKLDIESTLEDVILIKDALDIKKGIPLIFTQEYLNGIRVYVNNLLELAFPNMTIDFNITEKEFGIYITDIFTREIEDLSQGENILVKISFSTGLIQSMLKDMKYNILYFDEIDSALDTHRKTAVLDLLNKQSEYLGVEQMFLITHNEMLNNMNIDVIELTDREDDMLVGANVIWSIKDNK